MPEKNQLEDLKKRLADRRRVLRRLSRHADELRSGIEFQQRDGRLFYAVDFSEVHAYLHREKARAENFVVSLERGDREKASRQHYLGLRHLFTILSESDTPLYLLQPHTLEMWWYVKDEDRRGRRFDQLPKRLLAYTQQLSPDQRKLLASKKAINERRPEELDELTHLMEQETEQLWFEFSEFLQWLVRANTLKSLFDKQRLSYQTHELLDKCGIAATEWVEPTTEEENLVFQCFRMRDDEDGNYFSKMIDARALVMLRNINRLLERKNARLILVTRDRKVPKAIRLLAKDDSFGWPKAWRYLYSVETVFLDFIMRRTDNLQERLNLLDNAKQLLTSLERAVSDQYQQLERPADALPNCDQLATSTEAVLRQTGENWSKRLNILLSQAISHVSEQDEGFRLDRHENDSLLQTQRAAQRIGRIQQDNWELLREFFMEFVPSSAFRDLVKQDGQLLLAHIADDVRAVVSLKDVGNKIMELVNQEGGFVPVAWRSRSFMDMSPLHFHSPKFKRFVEQYQPWNWPDEQLNELLNEFVSTYSTAAEKGDAESVLFMAFVLGMLDYWSHAREMAERSQRLAKDHPAQVDQAEIEYFLAVAKCREGSRERDPEARIPYYVNAANHIQRALESNQNDPRYLNRKAAIVLSYREICKARLREQSTKQKIGNEAPLSDRSVDDAIKMLKEALEQVGDDLRLKLRVLNNLAYATAALHEPPLLGQAKNYAEQIKHELDLEKKSGKRAIPEGAWPFLQDTLIEVRARLAHRDRKPAQLRQCINEWGKLLKKELSEDQRDVLKRHIKEAEKWLQQLTASSRH